MLELLLLLVFVALLLRFARVSRELDELKDRFAVLERHVERSVSSARAQAAASVPPPSTTAATPATAPDTAPVNDLPPIPIDAATDRPPIPVIPAHAATAGHAVPPTIGAPAMSGGAARDDTAAAAEERDLEATIGGRWLLYTGVLILLLGVAFFLKYAFDNRWVTETGRVALGALAGAALVAGGLRLAARELQVFGQALIGTGLAVLYLSIYAALNYYFLIGPATAFVLMALVTALSALLADRQRSQPLAFIAIIGAFVTPFMVGGSRDAHLTLFSYDALLVAGTFLLARRHAWFALNAASYILTYVTLVAWGGRFYRDDLWLRTFLFLTLFCVLFVLILRETRRSGGPWARPVVALLSTAPVFYHIAAVVLTAQHPPAIHVYLIAATAVGLLLTAEPHQPGKRLLLLAAVYIPMFGSLTLPDGISWLMANVVTIVAVASLHAMAILDRIIRQDAVLDKPELVSLHWTGIGLFGLLYAALQATYPEFRGALAALIALAAVGMWYLVRGRDRAAGLHAAGLAFTLAAIGIAVQFDGPTATIGWAAEGAAVAWFGLRTASPGFQFGGLALVTLAGVRLALGYPDTPAAFVPLLNARSFATVFVLAVAYSLAHLFDRYASGARDPQRTRAFLHVGASVLTVMWLSAEIHSYWQTRDDVVQAGLYEQVMLSLAWGLYGSLLIAVGMWRQYAPDRFIGIAVIAVTVLKVFFVDLWQLGGIYRVIGFLGFGVLLVTVSYLYQQRRRAAAAPP